MWTKWWVISATIGGVMLPTVGTTGASYNHPRQATNTSTISWAACPDVSSTQCAFLEVPMDYTHPNSGSKVSIFLRKYLATASADQRLGSLLLSPGGPGGSGSGSVVELGDYISNIVDGRYDIIGFDQRAVNLTGPPTACHDAEYKFVQRMYQINVQGAPFPRVEGAGEIAHVAKLSAIQSSHYRACIEGGNYEMLRNSGSVAVVKDMERIVQALGEDGLNFIGYSYGSVLGATFAAMRPNLVKRMVLDGIFDVEAYFNDILQWGKSSMQETHKTLAGFASTCIEAGPTQCALAVTEENKKETVEGIAKRLDALYTKFGKEPLIVGDSLTGPGVILAHNVQFAVFALMYSPQYWPALAQMLLTLERGDGREFYPSVNSRFYGAIPEPYTQNIFNRSMQKLAITRESQYPILCGDSPRLDISIEEYAKYFREMGNINPVAEQVALIVGGCRGWPFRATETYTGPWTVEKGLNKTRFPILFVSLDADPVTPLTSAVKMSRGFGSESATLLIQQGFGHPSNIRDYFVNGNVPKNGTYCTPEPGWIYPTNSTQSKRSMLSKRDEELLSTAKRLGRTIPRLFGL